MRGCKLYSNCFVFIMELYQKDGQSGCDTVPEYHICDGRYKCLSCNYSSPRQQKIEEHIQAHKGNCICSECGKAFIKMADLDRHHRMLRNCIKSSGRRMKSQPFKMPVENENCDVKNGDQRPDVFNNNLQIHNFRKSLWNQKIDLTSKGQTQLFNGKPGFDTTDNDAAPVPQDPPTMNGDCNSSSSSITPRAHQQNNSEPNVTFSLIRSSRDATSDSQNELVITEMTSLRCIYCDYTGTSPRNLQKHYIAHKTAYKLCRFCPRAFERPSDLVRHEQRHVRNKAMFGVDRINHSGRGHKLLGLLGNTEEPAKPPLTIKRNVLHCRRCGFACTDSHVLSRHISKLHTNQHFGCDFCTLKFLSESDLHAHVVEVHAKIKKSKDISTEPTLKEKSKVTGNTARMSHSNYGYIYPYIGAGSSYAQQGMYIPPTPVYNITPSPVLPYSQLSPTDSSFVMPGNGDHSVNRCLLCTKTFLYKPDLDDHYKDHLERLSSSTAEPHESETNSPYSQLATQPVRTAGYGSSVWPDNQNFYSNYVTRTVTPPPYDTAVANRHASFAIARPLITVSPVTTDFTEDEAVEDCPECGDSFQSRVLLEKHCLNKHSKVQVVWYYFERGITKMCSPAVAEVIGDNTIELHLNQQFEELIGATLSEAEQIHARSACCMVTVTSDSYIDESSDDVQQQCCPTTSLSVGLHSSTSSTTIAALPTMTRSSASTASAQVSRPPSTSSSSGIATDVQLNNIDSYSSSSVPQGETTVTQNAPPQVEPEQKVTTKMKNSLNKTRKRIATENVSNLDRAARFRVANSKRRRDAQYQCDRCPYATDAPHKFDEHLVAHAHARYVCKICKRACIKSCDLVRHWITHHIYCPRHPGATLCDSCSFCSSDKVVLEKHMTAHYYIKKSAPWTVHSTTMDGDSSKHLPPANSPAPTEQPLPPIVLKRCHSQAVENSPKQFSPVKISCPDCNEIVPQLLLANHMRLQHSADGNDVKLRTRRKSTMYCKSCGLGFPGNDELLEHMYTTHSHRGFETDGINSQPLDSWEAVGDRRESASLNNDAEKERDSSTECWGPCKVDFSTYKLCCYCNKAFPTAEEWREHEALHNNPTLHNSLLPASRRNRLPLSNKQPSGDTEQLSSNRSSGLSLACPYCGESFSTASALKAHIPMHTNEKTFQCKHCGEKFPHKADLSTHLRYKGSCRGKGAKSQVPI